eukprot:8197086-Alexandrium_andersonii.AAC.1
MCGHGQLRLKQGDLLRPDGAFLDTGEGDKVHVSINQEAARATRQARRARYICDAIRAARHVQVDRWHRSVQQAWRALLRDESTGHEIAAIDQLISRGGTWQRVWISLKAQVARL